MKLLWLILGLVALGLGLGGIVHQRFFTNAGWFNWYQFFRNLNHETLILSCFVIGISLLVVRLINKER